MRCCEVCWLQDVQKHPLVLGVPLGRNGGPDKAISVDLGMKNMAQISTRELANSSSEFKQALLDRTKGGPLEGQPEDLRRAEPIPMSVLVKEDVMRLPIAAPVRALSRWHARCVPASNPSNTARFFFCAQAEREEAAAALSWQAAQG